MIGALAGVTPLAIVVHSQQTQTVSVLISGVPTTDTIDLFSGQPQSNGGFHVEHKVAAISGSGSITLPISSAPLYISASLISEGPGVELAPTNRFQEVTAFGQQLQFTYQTFYGFLPSTWWRGSTSGEGGSVVQQTGYLQAGSKLNLTAVPSAGWILAWWVVAPSVSTGSAEYRNWNLGFNSTSNPFTFTMNSPKTAMAVFVPTWQLVSTNSSDSGNVTITNLVQGQHVSLESASGTVLATSSVAQDQWQASLNVVGIVQPFSGRFVVTAPNGNTIVTTTPLLSDILAGQVYEF